MRTLHILVAFVALLPTSFISAQTDEVKNATSYKAEIFGSISDESTTPFWMVSNQYGLVPLDGDNAYLNVGVFHQQQLKKGFRWSAGLALVAAVPRYHNVYIQQIYAELGYKSLLLSIGSRKNRHSLWDQSLSSGDIVLSTNARPIPEINLSMPEFTVVPLTKGLLQVKGDFAVGRSFDSGYLEHVANQQQTYIKDMLWHHKSFYIRIQDTKHNFPLSGIIGVQHWAQWGGTSSNPAIGEQPHSFKDFIRVVCGKEGGGDATISDQINVLGNHYGSYDFKLTYTMPTWELSVYHQHYFDDKSGMIFKNGTDGLWGAQLNLPKVPWLQKIVTEYLVTRNQSGPFHFINFDHDQYEGSGGGADNYYNNGEYKTGVSYFGQGLGSPLLTSPAYNTDGSLEFKNTRVRAWHLAFEGDLSNKVAYRLKFTVNNNWGTHHTPFKDSKQGCSGFLEIKYHHPRLSGWELSGAIASDMGGLYGNNSGVSLKISKRGILKNWK